MYLTATLDAAIWGAELAQGEGPGRIYLVEPTGPIENDPNLTDKGFPGNHGNPGTTKYVKRWKKIDVSYCLFPYFCFQKTVHGASGQIY